MAIYSTRNLDHDPELAQALGNMVAAWAHAEKVLLSTLSRIADIGMNMSLDGYFRIPTFESRVKFIVALIPEWKTEKFDKAAISTAIEKLAKLAKTRNNWVHGDWCIDYTKRETIVFNHRIPPDAQGRRKTVKAQDVRNHCEAVIRRATNLADLIDIDGLRA